MKKLTLFIFMCISICQLTNAQQKRTQEVLYLKNGSIIRNAKSLQYLDSLIEIQTTEGSLFRFELSDLDSIAREPVRVKFRTHGYFLAVEAGLLFGHDTPITIEKRNTEASLQIVSGYQWNSHWATGIGAAMDIYQSGTTLPLFLRGMYTPLTNRLTPLISFDMGYGLYTKAFNGSSINGQLSQGGLFINPTVGFIARSEKRTAFSFSIGYRHQHAQQSFINEKETTSKNIILHRMSIRVGLSF
ncbi:hypothetical protein QNI19_21115 [Cytophagaceae bacterium DM2B3-1]|uniref:Outer membrane protein beta-barrel domain-containing protein n=1 Tax=Xanthocytophaga flava TaxID=3048013 RepID=A0ABT7CNX5_9BACT|nr:hypothetical protein [Xanthocytophaga flavus]MDJ1495453.1 hypothetical protein [Xanthocytophaga flavus]